MADELISRNEAIKFFQMYYGSVQDAVIAVRMLKELDTIDAVEVVRCKDCKRCDGFPIPNDIQQNEIGLCKINMMAVKQNGFCSYGERKDSEE